MSDHQSIVTIHNVKVEWKIRQENKGNSQSLLHQVFLLQLNIFFQIEKPDQKLNQNRR